MDQQIEFFIEFGDFEQASPKSAILVDGVVYRVLYKRVILFKVTILVDKITTPEEIFDAHVEINKSGEQEERIFSTIRKTEWIRSRKEQEWKDIVRHKAARIQSKPQPIGPLSWQIGAR